jgi:hypothetical protein
MAKTITIPLRDPIVGHGGKITSVGVREPNGREYTQFGDPFVYARTDQKVMVSAENDIAIKHYIEHCIVPPEGADVLLIMSQLSLIDMMAVKETVLGFFLGARTALFGVTASSSSSTSGSLTPPAAAS